MDEGNAVAYQLLEKGVAVLASDGQEVGTVDHVVAAPEQDIFHGLVISASGHGRRFVAADQIDSLHERGVDLLIDSAAVAGLPEPTGAAPQFSEDPTMGKWEYWARRMMGRRGGGWTKDK